MYYIWSFEHGAWWKPDREGYTTDLVDAGLYSDREAGQIVTSSIWLDEVAILASVLTRYDNKPPKFHPYNGAAENDEAR